MVYSKTAYTDHFVIEERLHWHDNFIKGLWESRYVTEGRDNLDGAAIQSTTINIEYGFFGLFLWNGWGYDSEYDELNIIPSINYYFNNIDIYFYFNHKEFFEDNESENDIGSGIIYYGLPYNAYLGLDWYHSFEADGSFYEISLGTELIPIQNLILEPIIFFGINNNYINDGHDGANHIGIKLDSEYKITKNLNLNSYIGYNFAIDSDPNSFEGDKLLNDFFWAGLGFELVF